MVMVKKNFDKWAVVYDLIYGEYKNDIDFYKREAKKIKGKVLEVACGTGRLYLEFLKEGVDVYGIDISGEMLGILKEKASRVGLRPKVYKADMRNFKINRKFNLILVPFRSFMHILTVDDQIKSLKNFKKHLAPKGKLILNFFFPKPELMVRKLGKVWKYDIKSEKEKFKVVGMYTLLDEINQIAKFNQSLFKRNKRIWGNKFTMTYFYKREFELLLRLAGFNKYKAYGGFNYKPLKEKSQEMVWVVKN